MDSDKQKIKTGEKEELLGRMQRKAKSILFIGIGSGLIIILSVIIGLSIPPPLLLAIVLAAAAFIVFQIVHIHSLGKTVRKIRDREAATNTTSA